MNDKRLCIGLGLLLAILVGCQTATQAPREKDKQANAYLEQAQAYEGQGNLVEALEQYRLAQAVDPNAAVITESIQRVEAQLQHLADTHYQAGLQLRDKGKWELAKKEFLKALVYWPSHEKAAAMLQQREPEDDSKFITHIIGPGESISKLAIKYYGDYRKYHHIANFNNMTDATQVRVGQKIMVPVIDGVTIADLKRISAGASAPSPSATAITGEYVVHQIAPGESLSKVAQIYYGDYRLFKIIADYNGITDPTSIKVGQKVKVPKQAEGINVADTASKTPESAAPYTPAAVEPPATATAPAPVETPPAPAPKPQPEPIEAADQVAEYRETGIALFNDQKYDDAIVELKKVLSASPDDAATIRYITRAYLEKGRQQLDAGQIEPAKTAFTAALGHDKNCQPCKDLLNRCRTLESESFRTQGEKLFQQNQFDKAIPVLERAIEVNPEDQQARDLLFQTHFQRALILYNKEDYLAAKAGFEKAAAVNPGCNECRKYIDDSLSSYIEFHYNEGIVFFGQENLAQAIDHWEKVSAIDPDYKDIKQNLNKARLLNERLERIRKSTPQ